MASELYPFVDIVVIEPVGSHFLNGDSMVILSTDLDEVLWACGPQSSALGDDAPQGMIGQPPQIGQVLLDYVRQMSNFPAIGSDRAVAVRVKDGARTYIQNLFIRDITLPDNKPAILFRTPVARGASKSASIDQLADHNCHSVLLSGDGSLIAASDGYDEVKLSQFEIAELIMAVDQQGNRLVKRLVETPYGQWPVAVARPSAGVSRYLMLLIDPRMASEEQAELKESDNLEEVDIHVNDSGQITAEAEPDDPLISQRDEEPVTPDLAIKEEIPVSKEKFDDWYFNDGTLLDDQSLKRPSTSARVEQTEDEKPDIVSTEVMPPAAPVAVAKSVLAAEPVAFVKARVVPTDAAPRPPTPDVELVGFEVHTLSTAKQSIASVTEKKSTAPKPDTTYTYDASSGVAKFIWNTDAQGTAIHISPEFASAVGPEAADLIGKSLPEEISRIDEKVGSAIGQLFANRDTWSGQRLLWPTDDPLVHIPVDLAALPVYNRARKFEGYRGFGIAHLSETIKSEPETTPEAAPDASAEHAVESSPPIEEETNLPERADEPVSEQGDTKPAEVVAYNPSQLSHSEATAFAAIGERLRSEGGIGADTARRLKAAVNRAPEPLHLHAQEDEVSALKHESRHRAAVVPASIPTADAKPVQTPDTSQSRSVLRHLPYPILIHAQDKTKFANPAFWRFSGYESIASFDAAGGLEQLFADTWDEVRGSDTDTGVNVLRKDGERVTCQVHMHRINWADERAVLLTFEPGGQTQESENLAQKTEQISADVALELAELRSILDTANDGVVCVDADRKITSINRSAEALFGYDSQSLVGEPFSILLAIESHRASNSYFDRLASNGVESVMNDGLELIGREAQGRFVPLFMTMGALAGGNGYCAVLRDITHWKRAEEELNNARREAEEASSQKTEFLARISHEIRTPLNAIIGFSELLMDEKFDGLDSERQRGYLKDINRSGNHVLDLVNDLLDISKIEAGQFELHFEDIQLNDVLLESVATMQPEANRQRVIIRSGLAADLPPVIADLRSIRQISLNLLSNGVRYTEAGGQVIVSTSFEDDGSVVIRFRDTGIGMNDEEIRDALQPFKQVEALHRPKGDGSGLGLPLTMKMAEANQALLQIESKKGSGTTVLVVFPPARVLKER